MGCSVIIDGQRKRLDLYDHKNETYLVPNIFTLFGGKVDDGPEYRHA